MRTPGGRAVVFGLLVLGAAGCWLPPVIALLIGGFAFVIALLSPTDNREEPLR